MTHQNLAQHLANEVMRHGMDAFSGGLGHAEATLIKRSPFEYEQEVRLIFVEERAGFGGDPIMFCRTDPNSLMEEIVLDPRLPADLAQERTSELRSLGFNGTIRQSILYGRVMFDIQIPRESTTRLRAKDFDW